MIDTETINRLKAYLHDGTLPNLARSGQWHFKKTAEEFKLQGEELRHRATNREVINEQKAAQIIEQRYKESTNGRDWLFNELKRQYYGISIQILSHSCRIIRCSKCTSQCLLKTNYATNNNLCTNADLADGY